MAYPYPGTAESCNILLIGKTYWSYLALPSNCIHIIDMTDTDIQTLQQTDNGVHRKILEDQIIPQSQQ